MMGSLLLGLQAWIAGLQRASRESPRLKALGGQEDSPELWMLARVNGRWVPTCMGVVEDAEHARYRASLHGSGLYRLIGSNGQVLLTFFARRAVHV